MNADVAAYNVHSSWFILGSFLEWCPSLKIKLLFNACDNHCNNNKVPGRCEEFFAGAM